VLGISVDFPDTNKAWAETLGLTYPLLSDVQREVGRAYGVLYDNPGWATNPAAVPLYLRAKRAWFVIDRDGILRYVKTASPDITKMSADLLQVLRTLQ
jgi:peroxiredoxin